MSSQLVSVCIPTHNGAVWIGETIASVLAQDVELELVVSDDASFDATVEIAASTGDVRVRVEPSASRLGMAANWNRAIGLSSGSYVKVLMQDDELLPGALARQLDVLEVYPSAAYAFGPRIAEGDGSRSAAVWISKFSTLHRGLVDPTTESGLINGAFVVRTLTRGRLRANAIGEPSVVLMRRSALDHTGLFDTELRQLTDLDLWLRLAAIGDVAFDARPVARFRVHSGSATARNKATGDAWLDRLRIVDGLHRRPETRDLVGIRHYLAAIGAGSVEAVSGMFRRERSLAATWRDVRTYRRDRIPSQGPGGMP